VGANQHFDTPSVVSGGLHFSDIAGGAETYCGITTGEATACWGRGRNGELGSGNTDSMLTPGKYGNAKAINTTSIPPNNALIVTLILNIAFSFSADSNMGLVMPSSLCPDD
jgi:hypothetical protein